MRHWLIDGNNVFGSRPDGWWNDRPRAASALAQRVAEWCRGHDDAVTLVFDPPVAATTLALAGGNLRIEAAPGRGRNVADDRLVTLATGLAGDGDGDGDTSPDDDAGADRVVVVSSDKGLIARLPAGVERMGVGRFRDLIGY